MKKWCSFFVILIYFIPHWAKADYSNKKNQKEDLIDSFRLMGKASSAQFSTTQNQLLWLGGIAFLVPFWNSDKRLSKNVSARQNHGYEKVVSDLGIIFNFPVIPFTTYYYGQKNNDDRMVLYSKELFAATNLALVESLLISFVPLHPRPTADENLTFWEKNFRDESSFPSGHVIGYATTTFKTFQYYGPIPAILPLGLFYISSIERVKTDKHYLSDVIASAFISLMASEGTRIAAENKTNHPVYKFIFEHEISMGFMKENRNNLLTLKATF